MSKTKNEIPEKTFIGLLNLLRNVLYAAKQLNRAIKDVESLASSELDKKQRKQFIEDERVRLLKTEIDKLDIYSD